MNFGCPKRFRGKRAGVCNRVIEVLQQDPNALIVRSPPDGHCLLHSLLSSWSLQVSNSDYLETAAPTIDILKIRIFQEIENNIEFYCMLNSCTEHELLQQRNAYHFRKVYNVDLVDLIPLIICECFNINIKILNKYPTTDRIHVVSVKALKNTNNNSDNNNRPTIYILRKPGHYDGLNIPSKKIPIHFSNQTQLDGNGKKICSSKLETVNDKQAGSNINSSNSQQNTITNISNDRPQGLLTTADSPTKGRIKILLINCRSIKSKTKQRQFNTLLSTEQPDIVLGTESHLDNSFKNAEIFPSTYEVIRHDRNHNGGGVFIAYKNNLIITEITDIGKNCELVVAKLMLVNQPDLYIGVYYRPPSQKVEGIIALREDLEKISKINAINILIGGDFNVPSINWETNSIDENPQYGQEINNTMLETISDQFLTQIVDEPTRGKNILDLIFTTNPSQLGRTTITPGISDHEAVVVEFTGKLKINKKPPRKIYLYNKADSETVYEEIAVLKNTFLTESPYRNAEENWTCFTKGLMTIIKKNVPMKTTNNRTDLPYMTKNIRRLMRQRKRKYDKAKKSGNQLDKHAYQEMQKLIIKEMDKAYNKYISNLFEETETSRSKKQLWSFIKSRRKDHVGIQALLHKDKIVTTAEEKAEALADQYELVFTNEDTSHIPDKGVSPYPSMGDINVTTKGVEKLLKQLDPKKAIGPDLILTKILKDHADLIAPIMKTIFQQSLDTGIIPKDWLRANITGIYKKGNKTHTANYRPVSLTSVSCKMLEHIIFSNVMKHLSLHKILKNFQHGFREKHSCESQLLTTLEDLCHNLDEKQQTDIMILDFAKAFDTVAHQRLLKKMRYYGIRQRTCHWIEHWLTTRHQTVVVDGKNSREVHVKSGVPQGTVLGPLLFLIFINDIGDDITSKIRLFADDCLLYNVVETSENVRNLQEDLDRLVKWAETWQMKFNPSKCYVLRVTRKKKPIMYPYTMMGVTLEAATHQTYLGVEITNDLSWNTHIKKICRKANNALNFIRRNLYDCPTNIKETAYNALVRPHLEYSSNVWDPYLQNDITSIEKIQRKAARFVTTKYRPADSPTQMMKDLHWHTLQERRFVSRQVMLYKIINKQTAVHLPDRLKQPTRTLRNQHSYSYINIRTQSNNYKYSFFPRTIWEWNMLPSSIVNAESINIFKNALWQMITQDKIMINENARESRTFISQIS